MNLNDFLTGIKHPLTPDEQEEMKTLGYEKIRNGTTNVEKVLGLEIVIIAYFFRSLNNAQINGFEKEHPGFDDYASMIDISYVTEPEVWQAYKEKYGSNAGLETGACYWKSIQNLS